MNQAHARVEQCMAQLRQLWLSWGLLPLGVAIVLSLLVAALEQTPGTMTAMTIERRFQALLAIAAALFLIGFSLDGHWTNAQKLARRLALAAGLRPDAKGYFPRLTARQRLQLAEHSELVCSSVVASVRALLIIGAAIAIMALLAAAAHLGLGYATMMLLVAASYQLYVLSRQPHYRDMMIAAAEGNLPLSTEPIEAEATRI